MADEPRPIRHIAVFCGSQFGSNPRFTQIARTLGTMLAFRNYGLVYGGGRVGLMGEVALTTLDAGGYVLGVIPQSLMTREVALTSISELIPTQTMHERKAIMADRADAFIALPGGFGTLDELFEILTWAQLGIHAKPIGLLNVDQFFTPLLAFLDHVVEQGLLKPRHRELLLVAENPGDMLDQLAAWCPSPNITKWATPEAR